MSSKVNEYLADLSGAELEDELEALKLDEVDLRDVDLLPESFSFDDLDLFELTTIARRVERMCEQSQERILELERDLAAIRFRSAAALDELEQLSADQYFRVKVFQAAEPLIVALTCGAVLAVIFLTLFF